MSEVARRKNHLKDPEKLSENYPKEFSAKRSSLTLKKLCCKFYKVIEVPWGVTPPRSPLFFYPTWPRCGFSAHLLVFFIGYRTSPWSLSSKKPEVRAKPSESKHQVFSYKGRWRSPYMTLDRRSERVPTIA